MTKNQREALTALRDVMIEHSFDISSGSIFFINDEKFIDIKDVDAESLTELIEYDEPNDFKRVAGRDFTGSGGDT